MDMIIVFLGLFKLLVQIYVYLESIKIINV